MPENPDPDLFYRAVELASGFLNHKYQKEYKAKIGEYYKQLLEKKTKDLKEAIELNRKFDKGKYVLYSSN